jgi:hypothetical protein
MSLTGLFRARGVAGPRLLQFIHGQLVQCPPLDGGNSQSYKELVRTRLNELRKRTLAVVASKLNRQYQYQEIKVGYWFTDDETTLSLKDEVESPAMSAARTFQVTNADLPDDIVGSPLTAAFALLSDEQKAKATVSPAEVKVGKLNTQAELVANATFRFLLDTKYLNPDHTLSIWGKALDTALQEVHSSWITMLCSDIVLTVTG